MNNHIFEEIADKLKKCILYGDLSLWPQLFKISDDVALQSMYKGFEDYFFTHKVKNCEIVIDYISDYTDNIEFRCSIRVEYQEYNDFTDCFLIKIEQDNDDDIFKIVDIDQVYSSDTKNDLFWHVSLKKDEVWWKSSISINEKSHSDDIPHNILARAVTRNIRFRETHIQLECASLLTCMMSHVIPGICRQADFPHENSEEKIKTVYGIVRAKFNLDITRPDRDNTWASKYLAPWYGLDEILIGHEEHNKITVSCNAFMTILYSLLRWSGFKTSQVVQFRIINQDYLIIQSDEKKLYLISHDKLTLCSKKTIYPSGKINKVFGAEWFIDFKNNFANISHELIEEYNCIAEHTFLPKYRITGNEKDLQPEVPNLLSEDFRHSLINSASLNNSGIFIWAGYANQTLFVSKPEAYLYWSIQSNWGSVVFNNEEEIFCYMKQWGKKSIFSEDDRIMTADQCIRHQTGGEKDIAVFLFAALKKFLNIQGCVVFTKKYEYYIYRRHTGDELVIYNVYHHTANLLIEGDVLLAFNDMCSYYPLRDKNHTNQEWYNKMIGK